MIYRFHFCDGIPFNFRVEIWKFELESYEERYTSFRAKLDIIFVFNYICTHKNYFKMENIHKILVYLSLHLTVLGA